MADAKLTALSELSVPTLDDLAYIVDDPAGTPASYKIAQNRLAGLYGPATCQGRLTTESGVPVSSTDRTAQSTIYFTPYVGDRVALYDGTRWKLYAFTERSLALSSLTASRPYDVFLYDNAGTLTLELTAWTSATVRATALVAQDGVYVKTGATTRRYLGTIYTSSASTTEDSGGGTTTQVGGKRFVWNAANRVARSLAVIDLTNTWTYTTSGWRVANGATAPLNCVEYVCGLAVEAVTAALIANANWGTGSFAAVAIGVDGVVAAGMRASCYQSAGGLVGNGITGAYDGLPGLGYHDLRWIENGVGSPAGVTFEGDNGDPTLKQSGLTAVVFA